MNFTADQVETLIKEKKCTVFSNIRTKHKNTDLLLSQINIDLNKY